MNEEYGGGNVAQKLAGGWCLLAGLWGVLSAMGQPVADGGYSIPSFVTGGANGTSEGGPYMVSGSLESLGAETLVGGAYEIHDGWHFETGLGSDMSHPRLGAHYDTGAGLVVLTWPAALQGYVLEACNDLSPSAAWQALAVSALQIGSEFWVSVPPQLQRQFYRLTKGSLP